ncbi:MAG TPA: phosphate acetyltransferase, partial [Campylobacterales bacterium]|nr:phosphate acetyltransferase [Campylobacterales bacterium]
MRSPLNSKSLYVCSHEAAAGSLIVSLGMMEFLKAKFKRVAFFRPFVWLKEGDHDTLFFLKRYGLAMSYEQTYGFSVGEVEKLIAQNRFDLLLQELIMQFKQLEETYDFVFIEGLNQANFSHAIDLDINLEIAKNFGTPYINILKGNDKTPEEIMDEILIDYEGIKASGVTHFATFVNRLEHEDTKTLQSLIGSAPDLPPVHLLREVTELDKPTIYEVIQSLHAKVVQAESRDFRRIVRQTKIAAMQLENFLKHVEEGDLVIVPADRADIVVGSILALYSKKYPNISGIVLTGGMTLAPSIQSILEGLSDS